MNTEERIVELERRIAQLEARVASLEVDLLKKRLPFEPDDTPKPYDPYNDPLRPFFLLHPR